MDDIEANKSEILASCIKILKGTLDTTEHFFKCGLETEKMARDALFSVEQSLNEVLSACRYKEQKAMEKYAYEQEYIRNEIPNIRSEIFANGITVKKKTEINKLLLGIKKDYQGINFAQAKTNLRSVRITGSLPKPVVPDSTAQVDFSKIQLEDTIGEVRHFIRVHSHDKRQPERDLQVESRDFKAYDNFRKDDYCFKFFDKFYSKATVNGKELIMMSQEFNFSPLVYIGEIYKSDMSDTLSNRVRIFDPTGKENCVYLDDAQVIDPDEIVYGDGKKPSLEIVDYEVSRD
jgi:hypothetical protein